MDKKIIIIVIAIIAIVAIVAAAITMTADDGTLENMGLVKSEYIINFYSSGIQLQSIESEVETLKNSPYLTNVNNETIKWLESFDNNEYVYVVGYSVNLIMKRTDYDLLKNQIDTSALESPNYIKATIKANMIETHSLGGGYKDVVYVQNIELVNTSKETI